MDEKINCRYNKLLEENQEMKEVHEIKQQNKKKSYLMFFIIVR